jgi:hypothetical protein
VPKTAELVAAQLRRRIGRLADADMLRLNRSLIIFLGLAG